MVKLEEQKHYTEQAHIEKAPLPAKAYLPLLQHVGKICVPQVAIGDVVLRGQKIAEGNAAVYAPIHASISGKIAAIQDWPHPVIGRAKTIIIENDGKDTSLNTPFRSQQEVDALTPQAIRDIVRDAGIVGMGGASFPTHIKLSPPKPVDTLIVNGAECEPYLNADNRLMIEKTKEIILGINLVCRCLNIKKTYIAIENNKPEAIESFRSSEQQYKIAILKSNYPQGGEKQLIQSVLKRQVPSGKLPFEIGVVVQNVATINAIYEAVYLNKPLYERIVTVTGACITNPKNVLARIGTPIKDLIDFCGPLKEEPAKIIIGGPMMGIAQYTDEVPVIKSTSGIILLNTKEARSYEEEACIRCGACIRACPANLAPCLINLASGKENWSQAKIYRAMDCIECGACNYVCPANRKLTQSIKRAKLEANK